jgi:hypothetical protein
MLCVGSCERSQICVNGHFHRLARDDERLPTVLAGLRVIVFACLLLHHIAPLTFRPHQVLASGYGNLGDLRTIALAHLGSLLH